MIFKRVPSAQTKADRGSQPIAPTSSPTHIFIKTLTRARVKPEAPLRKFIKTILLNRHKLLLFFLKI
jgi:hypothetical protein